MKDKPLTRNKPLRPLLVGLAVSAVCQTAFAQANINTSPFANRPLHLGDESGTSNIPGVKPNVMLFVDDSGSMQARVGGTTAYANTAPCTYNLSDMAGNNRCYYLNNPSWGFNRLVQPNNRMTITIDALNGIVDKYQDDWNWNIYSLWGSESRGSRGGLSNRNGPLPLAQRGRATYWPEVHPFMNAAQVKNLINHLSPTIGTPTTDRYINVARVMRDSIEYRCQKSYVVLISDGDANQQGARTLQNSSQPWERDLYGTFRNHRQESGATGFDNNTADRTTPAGSTVRYRSYLAGENNGIALFSHALNNADLKGASDRVGSGPLGRDREGGYWDENTTDADERYHNTFFGRQSIQTFVIGFGQGLSNNGRNYLRDAATCTGTKEGRCFFMPNTGAELAAAFNVVAESIAADNQAMNVATSSISTPAATGSDIPELTATLTLDTGNWSSQLRFSRMDSNGRPFTPPQIIPAGYPARQVIVNNGTTAYWLDGSSPNADFGIADVQEFRRGFVPWLMRNPAQSDTQIETAVAGAVAAADRTVTQYRERSSLATDAERATDPARQMADVIGSPVAALGRDSAGKQKYVITAANDGMTYLFQSTGDNDRPYDLRLNYLPAGMQRESADDTFTVGKGIHRTAETNYGKQADNPHLYLNNGGIAWVLTPKTTGSLDASGTDNGQRNQEYVMLGTMGQGGRGVYALSIAGKKRANTSTAINAGLDTPSAGWLAEVPMWESEKGTGNTLGYTISTGKFGIASTQWNTADDAPRYDTGLRLFAFVANGYRSTEATVPYDSSPTLYIYDAMGQEFGNSASSTDNVVTGTAAGELITKISVGNDAASGAPAGALSTPTLLDKDLNGIFDVAYAGDQFGNMYRFDLRGGVANWKVNKIYQGNASQPITAAPSIYRVERENDDKFVVVFGTGSDIFDHDRTDVNQQMVMGIHDDLSVDTPPIITATSSSILEHQMITSVDDSARYIQANSTPFNPAVHKAWRVMLAPGNATDPDNVRASEKVVVQPSMMLGTAFLTTRIYDFKAGTTTLPPGVDPRNTCFATTSSKKTGGNSWLMGFDALTGTGPDLARGMTFAQDDGRVSGSIDWGSNPNPGDQTARAGINMGVLASEQVALGTRDSQPREGDTEASLISPSSGQGNTVGELPSLIPPPPGGSIPASRCVTAAEKPSLNMAVADPNNPHAHVALQGPPCTGPALLRSSWREVPL